jgi:hypothetical protein
MNNDKPTVEQLSLEIIKHLVAENRLPFNGETSEHGLPSARICTSIRMSYRHLVAARVLVAQAEFNADLDRVSQIIDETIFASAKTVDEHQQNPRSVNQHGNSRTNN